MIEPTDQISIKTPNLKCRLFLNRYLAAGVYLSEAPIPFPPSVTHCINTIPLYLFTQGRGEGDR
jgi:hypothetical protein